MDITWKNNNLFLSFDIGATGLGLQATYCLMMVNMSGKSYQNPSRNGSYGTDTKKRPYFWPWPLSVILELQNWILHMTHHLIMVNISIRSHLNSSGNGKVIDWTHTKKDYFWPLTSSITLELQTLVLRGMHPLMMVNISAKSFQNPSKKGKVSMDRTHTQKKDPVFYFWPLSITLTLELQTWVLQATHRLIMVNINFLLSNFKIHQGMAKLWTRHKKKDSIFDLWPLSVTLTLELQTWILCATHHLMMVNISAKSFQTL